MLGKLLLFALLATAAVTICVAYLDMDKAKAALRNKKIISAVVKKIIKSDGVAHISLDALDEAWNEVEVEIKADDYDSSEIEEGTVIIT